MSEVCGELHAHISEVNGLRMSAGESPKKEEEETDMEMDESEIKDEPEDIPEQNSFEENIISDYVFDPFNNCHSCNICGEQVAKGEHMLMQMFKEVNRKEPSRIMKMIELSINHSSH